MSTDSKACTSGKMLNNKQQFLQPLGQSPCRDEIGICFIGMT